MISVCFASSVWGAARTKFAIGAFYSIKKNAHGEYNLRSHLLKPIPNIKQKVSCGKTWEYELYIRPTQKKSGEYPQVSVATFTEHFLNDRSNEMPYSDIKTLQNNDPCIYRPRE